MALTTYAELQASLAGWIHRTDLTTRIPDFITLAEAQFNRRLRVREMETVANGTLSAQTLTPPTDALEIQRFVIYPGTREIELEYSPPKNIARFGTDTGEPFYFTTMNQLYYVAPIPDGPYTYKLFYVQKIPALSISNTTNWLLTKAPDAYLYGALLQAAPYMKNDSRVPMWAEALRQVLDELTKINDSNQYPSSAMVVRSDMHL